VNVEQYVPFKNHYSYKDNSGVWDEENVHKIFINAGVIEVVGSNRRMSTLGFAALNFGGTGITHQNSRQLSVPTYSPHQGSALRVVKVGLLYRRDTSLDIGKRIKAGKWRLWSVILTNSQLLFFRDQAWATTLQEQMRYRNKRILVPPVPLLKPDEVLSLKDSVALHDRSHDKVGLCLTPSYYPLLRPIFGSIPLFSLYPVIGDLFFSKCLGRRTLIAGFHALTTRVPSRRQVSLCVLPVCLGRMLS
jgi:hypothetical protein